MFALPRLGSPETIAQAERHITEMMERLMAQRARIEEIERRGHHALLPEARRFLRDMEQTLEIARGHLCLELEAAKENPTT